jgi:hypothetical protein
MKINRNLVIGVAALLVPLTAELVSPETGMGFDVLLYWPFDFAYVLIIGVIFFASNFAAIDSENVFSWVASSLGSWLCWFFVSFILVAQLHLSLGYKL